MTLKKLLPRKFVLLFILSTLLISHWPFNINRAVAQGNSTLFKSIRYSIQFDEHYRYHPIQPEKPLRASWEVDIDFINTDIDAKWIIRVEQRQKGESWVLTDEYIQNLKCDKHGEVQIENGVAIFNPQSQDYIACDISSYRAAVERLIGATMDTHCDCIDPWLGADLHVMPNSQREYPVVYLAEAQTSTLAFEAGIRQQGGNNAYVETLMSDWYYAEKSQAFDINVPQTLWSGLNPVRFVETLNERHERYPNRWTTFWTSTDLQDYQDYQNNFNLASEMWLSWVDSLGNRQSTSAAQYTTMFTEEMTLYIGYNPVTREYFSGEMTNIGIDPGCGGVGGK